MVESNVISNPKNQRIKNIIDAVIIVWIVADIILLTSSYFINLDNIRYLAIIFDTALCIVLFIQFTFEMRAKKDKKLNIKDNWKGIVVDMVAMIPYELLTLVSLGVGSFGYIRLLRLVKIFGLFGKGKKDIYKFIEQTKLNYVILTFLIIIISGSIAMLVLESSPNDKINTPIDALWYIIATMSTVGYGDVTPESFGGKIIGIILMIVGVGFFSLLTALLSSWFIREHEMEEDELKNKIINMEDAINEMKSEIQEFKELLKKE